LIVESTSKDKSSLKTLIEAEYIPFFMDTISPIYYLEIILNINNE